MGRNETSETRRRVYHLVLEGRTGTAISKTVGISKQAASKHILALVSDGYIRPIDPNSRPRIYERTGKPFPEKSTPDHRGWSPVVRGHRTGRLFKLTHPPKRGWPWLWDNFWTRSGVDYYIVRDLVLETIDGTINIKSLRYIEGPETSNLTIWIDDEEILDGFQLLAHDDYATEVSILAANEIARRTGLRIALPEVPQPTEYGMKAPPGVVDVALGEGLRTDKVHFDRSKGDGEVETTDRDIALTWLHLPDELRILRNGLREVREGIQALGDYAKENNETVQALAQTIKDLDQRTKWLKDTPEILDDPPEEMYQ